MQAQFIIDFLITSYTYPCCKSPIKEYYFRRKCESALGPKWVRDAISCLSSRKIQCIGSFIVSFTSSLWIRSQYTGGLSSPAPCAPLAEMGCMLGSGVNAVADLRAAELLAATQRSGQRSYGSITSSPSQPLPQNPSGTVALGTPTELCSAGHRGCGPIA